MAVEQARDILPGDFIFIQEDESGPSLEVVDADHSASETRLSVFREGSGSETIALLPEDPVFVAFYSDSGYAEDRYGENANQ